LPSIGSAVRKREELLMGLRKDFLWGGAVAAHQLEGGYDLGGKGLSIMDVMTSGNQKTPRRVTDGIVEGEHYPNHEGIDFYHHFREDIKLLAEMGFRCSRCLFIWWMRMAPGETGS